MDKKNKSLIDDHEHGIILNESGTSVSFCWDAGEDSKDALPDEAPKENQPGTSGEHNSEIIS